MTQRTDLLAIGETMVMVTPSAGGRLRADGNYVLRPGGAESNVAAHAARLGLRSAWASAVGDDPLGAIVTDSLADLGVDVGSVVVDPSRPTAVFFKDPSPAGTDVFYYRSGSAASALSPVDLARWSSIAPRLVHVSGITAALSPTCRDLIRTIVFDRPFGSSVVSFDVNHRPGLWGEDAPAELRELSQASDVVFVGRDEADRLWGTDTADSIRRYLPDPGHLVVKDGPHDAVAYTPDGTYRAPSQRVEGIVDVVGAGDAFAAGWLTAMLVGCEEQMRLQLGHFVAARVLASSSDLAPLPLAREIVALLVDREGMSVDVADRSACN